jgi:hypothetical protein
MKGNIYFELYPAGLINQLISLELAVGLSYETKMNTVIYNIPKDLFTLSKYFTKQNNKNIMDLIDWKDKDNFKKIYIDEKSDINLIKTVDNLQKFYFIKNNNNINENFFAGDRERLFIDSNKDINLKQTLIWYSRFFYEKNDGLKNCLRSIKFKKEYYELSKNIINSLGKFNGAHVRLTDHIVRMFSISQNDIDEGFNKINNGLPVAISTDDDAHPFLNKINNNFFILDRYIMNNFMKDLIDNDFDNDISLAILCNIVLHHSEDFIGSAGSTFTGYIQRNRINNQKTASWKVFGEPDFISQGPYSWNNFYRGDIERSWWREWEECILI